MRTKEIRSIKKIDKVLLYEEVDSTNRVGAELALNGNDSFIVIADKQSAGKGRFKRNWISEPGGAYFSLGLNVGNISIKTQMISVTAAMAIIKMLSEYGIKGFYKWPNDVYVKRKKISGILIELIDSTAICGIGININNNLNMSEIGESGISMQQIIKKNVAIGDVIFKTVQNIFNIIDSDSLVYEFISSNNMNGRFVNISSVSGMYRGIVKSICPDGALLIESNGIEKKFYEGDVRMEEW